LFERRDDGGRGGERDLVLSGAPTEDDADAQRRHRSHSSSRRWAGRPIASGLLCGDQDGLGDEARELVRGPRPVVAQDPYADGNADVGRAEEDPLWQVAKRDERAKDAGGDRAYERHEAGEGGQRQRREQDEHEGGDDRLAPTDGGGEPLAHRRLVGQVLQRLGDLGPADEATIGEQKENAEPQEDPVALLEEGQRPHALYPRRLPFGAPASPFGEALTQLG